MTSCLPCLDLAALLMFNQQHIYLFGQIQTSQTGGQTLSDTWALGVKFSPKGTQMYGDFRGLFEKHFL